MDEVKQAVGKVVETVKDAVASTEQKVEKAVEQPKATQPTSGKTYQSHGDYDPA